MKKIKTAFVVFGLVFAFFAFYSCSQDDDGDESMSISDRITRFVSDLNDNPTRVYRNCHPDASLYNQAKAAVYWTNNFNPPIGLNSLSYSNTTVTAVVSGGNYATQTITFAMQEDGSNNWKIRTITVASFLFN
ncbi:MAG: hypothetical protein LBT33_05545 [Spirochaetia bacterium]|nr:hypothetical protein [Spirochaetia bacterium]